MASRSIYAKTFDEDVQQYDQPTCPECDGRIQTTAHETERRARTLLKRADDYTVANGKHPAGAAAGALYPASIDTGERLTQDSIDDALGGRRITVGGILGLNPLGIKPTPDDVLDERGDDASPLKERRNRAVSFFTNSFNHRDADLGDRRPTLELTIDDAYERKGITEDVSTHDRESPTVRDILNILEEMSNSPDEYVVRVEAEGEKISTDAVWLLNQLRPFADGGQLENLGRESEFDIRDEKVVYLDLQQRGGSIGGHTSLLMELLISLVYERAKETDKEVVFVIDEARYLMKDAATLEYLETIFRHHRHHDLSIQLVTQTVDEFFQHDVSKIILDQCAIKQFHKLDGMNEQWANVFGLNYAQMRFVQDAIPGSDEKGYSQALLGVDGEWRGMEVRALPHETDVIENELTTGFEVGFTKPGSSPNLQTQD